MQDDVKNNEIKQKDVAEKNTGISRRRFTQASMVTPVVMSLASRPVLGQGNQCTTSGMESGNHSGVGEVHCEGCSPGFWKGRPQSFLDYTGFKEDDLFSTIFTSDTLFPGLTLMQILMHECSEWTVTDPSNVGFHTVAALLNASASENGHMTYGYTVNEVIALYNGTDYTNAQLAYKFLNLEDESPLYPWITCPLKPGGDQIPCSEVTIPPTP